MDVHYDQHHRPHRAIRGAYYGLEGGQPVARVEVEYLHENCFALHIHTQPEFRRMGYMTQLFSYAVRAENAKGRTLVYEDDPKYLKLGGIGYVSEDGKAFFNAYRQPRRAA